jgi:FkbM family methyltransferase
MGYSQGKEQDIILANTENKGRFLDIGAYDGITFSNTYALVEQGWSGVMVEPSPTIFPKLLANMREKEIMCCNSVITATNQGIIDFYDSRGDFLSTNVPEMFSKWPTAQFDKYQTKAVTITDLFHYYGMDFNFISIDVEGANWEILQSIPFGWLSFLNLLCIEFDDKSKEMERFMKDKGFGLIFRNGENMIFKKN